MCGAKPPLTFFPPSVLSALFSSSLQDSVNDVCSKCHPVMVPLCKSISPYRVVFSTAVTPNAPQLTSNNLSLFQSNMNVMWRIPEMAAAFPAFPVFPVFPACSQYVMSTGSDVMTAVTCVFSSTRSES